VPIYPVVMYVQHKQIFVDGAVLLQIVFLIIITLLVQLPLQMNVEILQILAINMWDVQAAPPKILVYIAHQLKLSSLEIRADLQVEYATISTPQEIVQLVLRFLPAPLAQTMKVVDGLIHYFLVLPLIPLKPLELALVKNMTNVQIVKEMDVHFVRILVNVNHPPR